MISSNLFGVAGEHNNRQQGCPDVARRTRQPVSNHVCTLPAQDAARILEIARASLLQGLQ